MNVSKISPVHTIVKKEKFKERPGNYLKSKLATSILRDRTNNSNVIPNQDLHQKSFYYYQDLQQ